MIVAVKHRTVHEQVEHLTRLGYSVLGTQFVRHPKGAFGRDGTYTRWGLWMDGLEVAVHRGSGFEAIERFHDIVEGVAWQ